MILRMGGSGLAAYCHDHSRVGGQLATTPEFHRARWIHAGAPGAELLQFPATCPRCRRQQNQCGFSRAALLRLLDDDLEIQAYCTSCRDFWSISEQERRHLIGEFDD